jgi:hypothetical protein
MNIYKSNEGVKKIRLLDTTSTKLTNNTLTDNTLTDNTLIKLDGLTKLPELFGINKVLFFDDSIYELRNAYKYKNIDIYFVKNILYNNFDSYLNILSDETLFFVNKLNLKYKHENVVLKGISITTLNKLNNSIINNELNKIIFDWDHTLSLFEGWFSDMNFTELKYNIGDNVSSIENYAEYILGGSNRIKTLQIIFINSIKHDIPIYILTNNIALDNPYKFKRNRSNFYNLLKSVKINVKLNNIYFNTYLPGFKLDFINEVLLSHTELTFNRIKHSIFMNVSNDNKNKKHKKKFSKYYEHLVKIQHKYIPSIEFTRLINICLIEIY